MFKEKFNNETNNICQLFKNALEECLESNDRCITVKFPRFKFRDEFNLANCLDKNNQITIQDYKFNVEFKSDADYYIGSVP